MRFSLPSGLDRILELIIAAQIPALALEADGGPPPLLFSHPIHSGNAAGVIAPHRSGGKHLHTGPVDISQTQSIPGPAGAVLTSAALCMTRPQMVGFDYNLSPAVALAAPRCSLPNILRRFQNGQMSILLACQIHLFSQVTHTHTPLLFAFAGKRTFL